MSALRWLCYLFRYHHLCFGFVDVLAAMARSDNFVPGTVLLALEQNTESLDKLTGAVILVPTPSSDDRDPLRWSRFRKLNHLTLITAWIFFLSAFNNWLGPPIDRIMADTDSNFNQMNVRPILAVRIRCF